MIPTTWHSGKDKTLETVKKSDGCQGLGEAAKRWISGEKGNFRAMKVFSIMVNIYYTFVKTDRTTIYVKECPAYIFL